MGRLEKRPDNPGVRGDISRAAESALWAVVEDLENLQQNVLKSLQEDVKRLQSEKERLADEIHQLVEEKEHLQEVRRITEQQVLIRQLSEALAKHICSQLQSSLAKIANQTESQIAALKSAQSSNIVSGNLEPAEKMLGSLDDNLTIAFNSLQQELKNYQTNLSQQLSRMYSQQQQGEAILEDFISQLRGDLTKTIQETSQLAAKSSPPTVIQPPEIQPPNVAKVVNLSPPTVLQPPELQSPASFQTSPSVEPITQTQAQSVPPIVEKPPVPTPAAPKTPESTASPVNEIKSPPPEPISVLQPEISETETTSKEIKSPPEPISVLQPEISETETTSKEIKSPPEPISVLRPVIPDTKITSPPPEKLTEPISPPKPESSSSKGTAKEPISVIQNDNPSPPSASASKRGSPSPTNKSRSFSNLSPVQIGFLLIVASAVMSSLYNVAIKGMFYKTSQTSAVLEIAGLISPTVGNIMLILTLRLMVVVPLMMLLAPMMHPQVWQDLQSLKESLGKKSGATRGKQRQTGVQLIIASGCFLFLSQVLIYFAIGQVATGTAIALFFIYPVVVSILSWFLLRDRPSGFRATALAAIFGGELLVFGGTLITTGVIGNNSLGGITAILAGVSFACYLLLTRASATKIHPVSLTFVNFATMLALSFIFLMLPLPNNWSLTVDPSKVLEIVLSAAILGVLTLVGYVCNHLGVSKLGAPRSAIIGAGVPILTVIFAGLVLQETLNIVQILGVLFVTFGAAAFSFGQIRNPNSSSNSEN
ncbi:DMT family transporter [Nostoc sp. UHCC 0870]|uniref:DMT family transporter n=1 Tax=Nostoc sp. UHCC 0870 TaxID=2914041 RepID=UPI001EDF8BAB|nr:DMT family transporter [Nostoc sp. UHCC 0870]UKO98075.1 EamA family transporter [Nostoc sp. UHCC 0870]